MVAFLCRKYNTTFDPMSKMESIAVANRDRELAVNAAYTGRKAPSETGTSKAQMKIYFGGRKG